MPGPGQSISPIQLDQSRSLIVIHCMEHPWWSASRFHLDEAQDAACGHEDREHPGEHHHRDARRKRVLRRVSSADTPSVSDSGSRV